MTNREHDGDITPGMNSYYGDVTPNIPQPPKQKRAWGAGGQRWDEECARCHKTTVIDNDTELCERCASR